MNRALLSLAACALALFSLASAQAQSYKLYDTGYLGSSQAVDGTGESLSPTGIVGGYSGTAGDYRGYLWQSGTISALPDITGSSGDTAVLGINSAGIAVGVCSDYFEPDSHAARWKNGTVTDLGSLNGGTYPAAAFAINDSNLIVGWSCTSGVSNTNAAYYDTSWHALPALSGAPASPYAEAHAVNASGEIAGYCTAADGEYHATLWKGGKAYDLGLLGGTSSTADGMNDAGQVVGNYQTQPAADGSYTFHAFLWTPTTTNGTSGTMKDLGTLPGEDRSQAHDINNNGQVVGLGDSDGFLWDATHGMRSLTNLVTSAQLNPTPDAYYVTDATAINDSGQIAGDFVEVFVGSGDINHGCLLDPGAGTGMVKPKSLSFTPNPVVGGQSATGTVTLTAAAPAGGAAVTITDNGTSLGSITVPAGSVGATFTLTTGTVTASETDTFGAVYNGTTVTTTLTITPAAGTVTVKSLSVSPTSVTGGTSSTGTITLTGAAPAGGLAVTLKSSDTSSATVAGTINIAAGATSASFKITTKAVTSTKTVTITATAGSTSKTATLTVNPAAGTVTISTLALTPTSVTAGSTSQGKITLSAVAPTGGATIALKSSDTSSATVPASVTIAAGNKSISFTITTKSVTSTKTPTITATAGSSVKTATLTITPATTTVTIQSLSVSPTSVKGGSATSTGTITLTGAAPTGGLAVTLKSSDTSSATVAATINIAAGATSASFKITTYAVTSTKTVTITSTANGTSKTATLTVTGGTNTVTVQSLTATPSAVSSNGQTSCTVTLSGAAPAGGASVPVTLNGSAFYTVTVPAGQTSASFNINWGVVSTKTTDTLSASYGGKTVSATVTVSPTTVTLKSYTFSPNPIVGGQTATAKVTLSAAAPAGGAVISITYSGTAFYQFVIPAGSTSGTYTQPTGTTTSTVSDVFVANYNGSSLSKTLTITP